MTSLDTLRAKYETKAFVGKREVTFLDSEKILRELTRLTQIETAARAVVDANDSQSTTVGNVLYLVDRLRDTLTPTGGANT